MCGAPRGHGHVGRGAAQAFVAGGGSTTPSRPRRRLLHLQRHRRRRSGASSSRGTSKRRLRQHRRPSRRRHPVDLLRGPTRADVLGARDGPVPVPGHRGRPSAIGGGPEGTSINIPLPPLRAIAPTCGRWVVGPPLVDFAPDVLITQDGADPHHADPLAHLAVSCVASRAPRDRAARDGGPDGGRALGGARRRRLHRSRSCPGHGPTCWRWWAAGPSTRTSRRRSRGARRYGSGWAAAHRPRWATAGTPSYRPWEEGYDPDSWLDREVLATRRAAFPQHRLDPEL